MIHNLTSDQVVASTVKFLVEGGDEDAANLVLACKCDVRTWEAGYEEGPDQVFISLVGPRVAYEHLSYGHDPIREQVWNAISAILPQGMVLAEMDVRAELVQNLGPDWHGELLELVRGKSIHNQAVDADNSKTWNGLRFRSITEMHIAEALDKTGVLFFPLPKGRLNGSGGRVNREPDFLVCKNGRWGILEVDGEPFHPPARIVHDHARDALFQRHGVKFIQHRDSEDCYMTPDKVVAEFLELLDSY